MAEAFQIVLLSVWNHSVDRAGLFFIPKQFSCVFSH